MFLFLHLQQCNIRVDEMRDVTPFQHQLIREGLPIEGSMRISHLE